LSQAVAYVCATKVARKRNGTYSPHAGGGEGGGRPPALSEAKKKLVLKELKKTRFARVRAPDLKKRLKLKCSLRVVQQTLNDAGYRLPKLVNRRVLDKATKRKRVAWATTHQGHDVQYWKRRGFGDAHFWHLARTAAELEACRGAKQKPVYRTKKEAGDPRFHGGKKGVYKQGRRVGIFGVLAGKVLRVAWLPGGKLNGKTFSAVMRKNGRAWLKNREALILDGEGCLHGKAAEAALEEVGVEVEKLPPNSPDFNPIENAWARLDERLAKTDPSKLETEKEHKKRVNNAVKWVNRNETEGFKNSISSMPDRLAEAKQLKGARTGY